MEERTHAAQKAVRPPRGPCAPPTQKRRSPRAAPADVSRARLNLPGVQPWRCLCRVFSQMTRTTPLRLTTLHLSQMHLTDARTFISCSITKYRHAEQRSHRWRLLVPAAFAGDKPQPQHRSTICSAPAPRARPREHAPARGCTRACSREHRCHVRRGRQVPMDQTRIKVNNLQRASTTCAPAEEAANATGSRGSRGKRPRCPWCHRRP